MSNDRSLLPLRHALRSCFVILSVATSSAFVRAQEVMVVERLSVRSEGSTLVAVDSEGETSSTEPTQESGSSSKPAVSQIGPGERVEVVGTSVAQMIISEGVTAHLEPGTQIEIPKVEKDQKATASLKLLKGKMFIQVDPGELSREGKVEFRLETPKSLLAVKGTRFVVESTDASNSVALLEGGVAVKDLKSGKAALLQPGQATDITEAGDLPIRRLTRDESEYAKVFDEGQFVFIPFRIDRDSIKKRGYGALSAKLAKFDGSPSMGIRGEFEASEPPKGKDVHFVLSFKPERLTLSPERLIGYLITWRTTTVPKDLRFYTRLYSDRFQLGSDVRISTRRDTLEPGTWQTHFIPIQNREASSDAELESWAKDSNTGFYGYYYPTKKSLEQVPRPPFILEVASIKFVTLGEEK